MFQNYKKLIHDAVFDEKTIVKATFRGGLKQWIKVIIRPVELKGKRHVQFSYFTARQDITKNYKGKDVERKLQEVLRQHFEYVTIQTTEKTIQIENPKKGRTIIQEHKQKNDIPIDVSHDHQKSLIISANTPLPFLQKLGIQAADGKIKADKYNKFRQINEFLKIIEQTIRKVPKEPNGPNEPDEKDSQNTKNSFGTSGSFGTSVPLSIVDFGCGNGYLTSAVYYYFTEILKRQTNLIGVDIQGDLLKKLQHEAKELDWKNITFQENSIIDYKQEKNADIVIALHACDTATDEALAKAIQMDSKAIFASPCCHHNLQEQLHHSPTPSVFQPIFQHGILRERVADILTDTFRALILQIMGYETDVIQFISYEHTTRNILIRSLKKENLNIKKSIHEYNALKKYWRVTPHLEILLGKYLIERL